MMNFNEKRLNEKGTLLLARYNLEKIDISGKEIARPKSAFFNHTAIVLGKQKGTEIVFLLHNQLHGGIQWITLDKFAPDKKCGMVDAPHDHWAIVIERALKMLECPEPYDGMKFNCQHFTTYARCGKKESEALQRLITSLGESANDLLKGKFPG